MAFRLNDDQRNAVVAAFGEQFDGGTLTIFTGTQPASGGGSHTDDTLVTITLPSPAFGAPSAGVIEKDGTWSGTAAASGVAGWARLEAASTGEIVDADVSETGGGGEIIIDDENIVGGGTVTVTAATITQPAE